jgi:L,D-transpeptidase ErfK/SrfK
MQVTKIAASTLLASLMVLPLASFAKQGSLSSQISPPGEKIIIVDPNIHQWGAYDEDGNLLRSGLATAGGRWCRDIRRSCRTKSGSFRIFSLGSRGCKSSKYPLPRGGAPMPYCMFFNGGQGLHGSYQVVRGNVSHGCVRLHVEDAEWLRFNFVDGPNAGNGYRGTRVVIRPY